MACASVTGWSAPAAEVLTTELEGWLRLALTPGVGDTTARALLVTFGSPESIFLQNRAALAAFASPAQVEQLLAPPDSLDSALAATRAWLDAAPDSRRVLTLADTMYPAALLEVPDPALMVYAIASPAFWEAGKWPEQALAVVGSRNPTPQGASNARMFARDLAQRGVCVVSGLALGVDGAAHEGALEGGAGICRTIAVVGTGLDRVYPARHRDLAHRIAEHGVLLSEYPLGTPPLAHNFPRRNRIICGLARGTLVVEAALQSGSLITARLSGDQGKDVFAIPGSIHSPQSKGCHALIRQGAKLVESAQDIWEEFPGWQDAGQRVLPAADSCNAQVELSCPVLHALGYDPMLLDTLQARTGWGTAELQVRLLELELSGEVARLPGGLFQRLSRA